MKVFVLYQGQKDHSQCCYAYQSIFSLKRSRAFQRWSALTPNTVRRAAKTDPTGGP